MEFKDGGEAGGEVLPVVAAWVEMKFVRDFAGGENFVKGGSAAVEAVVVLRAAVEIDFQAGEIGSACKNERVVAVPESRIGRRAKGAKSAQKKRLLGIGELHVGKFIEKSSAIGADGDEKFGMAEGDMQRAVAAHGDSGDAARTSRGRDAVGAVDERDEFADEEIFVASATVAGVDVEAGVGVRCDDEKFADFLLLPEVFDEIPAAGGDEKLFVAAQSVEKIEHGIVAGFGRVVAGRKDGAVANVAGEDLAVRGAAFDASESGAGGGGEGEKTKN